MAPTRTTPSIDEFVDRAMPRLAEYIVVLVKIIEELDKAISNKDWKTVEVLLDILDTAQSAGESDA